MNATAATAAPPRPAAKATEALTSKMAYLTRVLKTPTIGRTWQELGSLAREENWSHEEYLTAVLERQVADRESAGTVMRIRTAHFPANKTIEDFNLDHLPSLRKDVLAHLATSTFVAKADNVVLLGPPGLGKTHLAIGLGIKACQAGYSVLFDTATNWIDRLARAHQRGQLEIELKKIRRYKLIIVDEVGYIPFDTDAANLFFQLVASRYETGSILVTSNLPFGRWGETFSDDVVAAAMIDRLVHHAEVLTLSGDSYRTRARRELLAKDRDNQHHRGVNFPKPARGQDSESVDTSTRSCSRRLPAASSNVTGSASPAPGTSARCSPPTSERASPSATTPATQPRSASTTAISTCAGRSHLSSPAKQSRWSSCRTLASPDGGR